MVKKKGFTSKHKIADKWETEPYEIVSQRSDGLPVYMVVRNDREVDNFPIVDGEVDQPVYEGPQTQSHTKQLMRANVLMDQMFDVTSGEIFDDITDIIEMPDKPVESIRNPILQFWYQQAFTVYMVCCDLAEARTCSINC